MLLAIVDYPSGFDLSFSMDSVQGKEAVGRVLADLGRDWRCQIDWNSNRASVC